ncbi:MAG: HD domain-containing protein, partial [Acidimicrobiales bacterium]|nr:HD domain-containing protein [Acidimicrobiales bacterium]
MPFLHDELLGNLTAGGRDFTTAHTAEVDAWLTTLLRTVTDKTQGVALVALGGYGRRELAPYSDIDVMLLHTDGTDVTEMAEKLWYPIWDAGVKLGHSVRTVKEALALAKEDLPTATALLSTRLIDGDSVLAGDLRGEALQQWRAGSARYLAELGEAGRKRHEERGEVAFLLEPDIKNGRGGMRDVHALRWAEAAEPQIPEADSVALDEAYETLLRIRVELHRVADRPTDVLLLEQQDDVAAALGIDADELMAQLAGAARLVAWTSDATWHRLRRANRSRRLRNPKPREVAEGVLLDDRVIRLDRRFDLSADPLTPLRLANAAARHQGFIERDTLSQLVAEAPDLPTPWPDDARELFTDLLLAGPPAIEVIEALDQVGLMVRLIPEWEPARSRPQRNAYHTYTVDRHLLETAAQASKHADRVDRPDLLALGALLHDIGKGYPGDHTEVGMKLVDTIAARMGFTADEIDV